MSFKRTLARARALAGIALVIVLTVAALGMAPACQAELRLQDEMGRTVTVPDRAHRLVCLAPSVTDTVYALGAGEDVAGVSDFTKFPPEAAKKPSVGLVLSPSIEAIVALRPDLVLGIGDMSTSETVQKLERLNIPVFLVQPHGIHGIYVSIESLGRALNRGKEAQELVSRLRSREQAIRARISGKPAVRVFMPLSVDPVITIGKNAFVTGIITAAGGKSVTDDLNQDWPNISIEAVLARQPDYLLIERRLAMTVEDLKKKPGWKELRCVRENRIFFADERIVYPSPIVFDALESLASQFHPLEAH